MINKKKTKRHIIKSEICDKNGHWTLVAVELAKDANKLVRGFLLRHKGKCSVTAMEHILSVSIRHQSSLVTMVDSPIFEQLFKTKKS